jgi:hypothetical protein
MQLIYTSRPFGFDDLALMNILLVSRHNNERDNISGSLICREDMYLQMLEGPRAAVTAAFERILRDGRHAPRSGSVLDVDAGRSAGRSGDGSLDGRGSQRVCPAGRERLKTAELRKG